MKPALVFLLSAAWCAAAEFPHARHQDVKCVECHAAARKSTRAADNLLPSAESCGKCHADARQVGSPRKAFLKEFSHDKHLSMGNPASVIARAIDNGTYLGANGKQVRPLLDTKDACLACHRTADQPQPAAMADCLTCHNKIEVPFSCATCHEAGARLKPANHSPQFIDEHSRGTLKLDRTTCAVCHGRGFTCMGCH